MTELLAKLDTYRLGIERRHGSTHSMASQLRILHGDMSKWLGSSRASASISPNTSVVDVAITRAVVTSTAAKRYPAVSVAGVSQTVLPTSPPMPAMTTAVAASITVPESPPQQQQQKSQHLSIARESQSSVHTDATFDLHSSPFNAPRDSGPAPNSPAEAFAFPQPQQPQASSSSTSSQHQHHHYIQSHHSSSPPGMPRHQDSATATLPARASAVPLPSDAAVGVVHAVLARKGAAAVAVAPAAAPSAAPGYQQQDQQGVGGGTTAAVGTSLLELANQLNSMTMKQQVVFSAAAAAAAVVDSNNGGGGSGGGPILMPSGRSAQAVPVSNGGGAAVRSRSMPNTKAHISLPTGSSHGKIAAAFQTHVSYDAAAKAVSSMETKEPLKQKTKSKWGALFGSKK